jgi:pantoate--beta-alanine ligase
MRIARTIAEVRTAVAAARRRGSSIGLVPTMGAFHEGHLSLMRRARAGCEVVAVSLFVNPTQFNDRSDLEAYPRDEQRDLALAAEAGVDVLFAPAAEEIYASGFATRISVGGVSGPLEGAHRGPEHFEGVATVVAKLVNIVTPDRVYFGQKDAQQTAVVKRLVRDLNIPVSIEVCPTVRAGDGLALSSRNARLKPQERMRATGLYRALRAAHDAIEAGERDPRGAVAAGLKELRARGIEPEYFEIVDPETFTPVRRLHGEVLAVLAAGFEGARLIDNLLIRVPRSETHDSGAIAAPTQGACPPGAQAPDHTLIVATCKRPMKPARHAA